MATPIPDYQILRKINEGGMATVYLAIQVKIGREVALKIMSPELSANPKYSNLFFKEANIVGTLSHPNIVSIFDVGTHEGKNYIAMDYLPGTSFKERISNGLSISEVLRVTKEIASALDHMHDRGYVHLDLKPDNILFRKDGAAVLLDFGIAMTMAAAQKANQSGSVAGTPQYMSPEQAQGKPLDGRSDIYSLGILFHEMLAGQPPYSGPDAVQIAVKHMTAPLPSLPVQYKMFQPLLNKMLAKKPEDRFRRGNDIIQAINALEGGVAGTQNILLEPTQPTALQAFSLIQALLSALGALLGLLVKRFFGRFECLLRLRFSPRHGLVLKSVAQDPLEANPAMRGGNHDTATAEIPGDSIAAALASHRARRLAPPMVVYVLLALLLGGTAAGLYVGLQGTAGQAAAPAVAQKPVSPAKPAATAPAATATASPPAVATPPAATAQEPQEFRIKALVLPQDASIRIVELDRPYETGMTLPPGRYTLAFSHADHWPQERTIELRDGDAEVDVVLKPRQRSYQVGDIFMDAIPEGGNGPSMVVLPAGSFTMGDASGKIAAARPAHKVTIAKPFAIGRYEVSWAEYRLFLQKEGLETPSGLGARADNFPVTGTNWDDAQAYVAWLRKKTGKPYRLPSEAEWEYAARAGTDTPYWWGDQAKDQANCRRGCTTAWNNKSLFESMAVGSFNANPFGLYDTAGNAAEWVQDCHEESYSKAPTDGSAWNGDTDHCYHRVIRGGSFNDTDNKLYSRSREKGFAQIRKPETGFRVAMDL